MKDMASLKIPVKKDILPKEGRLKTLMKMFRLGIKSRVADVSTTNKIRPLDKAFKSEQFPPHVERLWNYWINNCHDDAQSFKDMIQVWMDMDMIYFNCCHGDEKILTKEYGLVPISSVSGQNLILLTSKGWQEGDINQFGRDFVYDVYFKRKGKRTDRIVRCTLNHRWRLLDKSFVETKNLKMGDKIPYINVEESIEPIQIPFWSFSHIDFESKKEEDIYCAIVPETQDFVLEDGLLTGNSPIISKAMHLIADEVVQADLNMQCIGIEAEPKQKKFLMEFFDKINLYAHIRAIVLDIIQYGNCGVLLAMDDDGVQEIIPINIFDFKSILAFTPYEVQQRLVKQDKFFFEYMSRERIKKLIDSIINKDNYASYFKTYIIGYQVGDYVLPPWRFIHFKNKTTRTPFRSFGCPLFLHAIAPYRQYDAAMTLQVVARGARMPIDKYSINAPNIVDPVSKMNFVTDFIREFQNSGFGSTKKEEMGIGETVFTIKDLFDYEQITPNIDLGKMDDIQMLRDDLIQACMIPRNLIDPNDSAFGDSGVALSQKFKPFARLVFHVQTLLLEGVTQLSKIHMIQSKKFSSDEIDFMLTMPYPESQIDKEIIDSQKDLLDLSSSILDMISQRLLNGEAVPEELVKLVMHEILPYDPARVDTWLKVAKDSSGKMQQGDVQSIEGQQPSFDKENFSSSDDANNFNYEKVLYNLHNSVKLYEQKNNRKNLTESVKSIIIKEKIDKLREGIIKGKHFFSSKNMFGDFRAEQLREWDTEDIDKKDETKKLVEEVKYVFTADDDIQEINKNEEV